MCIGMLAGCGQKPAEHELKITENSLKLAFRPFEIKTVIVF